MSPFFIISVISMRNRARLAWRSLKCALQVGFILFYFYYFIFPFAAYTNPGLSRSDQLASAKTKICPCCPFHIGDSLYNVQYTVPSPVLSTGRFLLKFSRDAGRLLGFLCIFSSSPLS